MKNSITLSFLAFSLTVFSQNTDKEYESLVYKLLDQSGSSVIATQLMDQMIDTYKSSNTNVPDEFWESFKNQFDIQSLQSKLIPVYAKHYTKDDLKEIIKFYKSDLGKKIIEKTPLISQESYDIGAGWGKEITEKVIEKMKAAGY